MDQYGNPRSIKIDNFPHEIIEFPAIIVDLEPGKNLVKNSIASTKNSDSELTLQEKLSNLNLNDKREDVLDETITNEGDSIEMEPQIIAEFHSYVKPTQFPILTDYCKKLRSFWVFLGSRHAF